jgi:hypothetical protein
MLKRLFYIACTLICVVMIATTATQALAVVDGTKVFFAEQQWTRGAPAVADQLSVTMSMTKRWDQANTTQQSRFDNPTISKSLMVSKTCDQNCSTFAGSSPPVQYNVNQKNYLEKNITAGAFVQRHIPSWAPKLIFRC